VVGTDGEVLRVVGTLTDITDNKISEERLLHDAVHDNLTSLPNRELFLDRLDAAIALGRADENLRPTLIVIDLDRFKQVNSSVGMAVGDSILLTIARRLSRLLKPQDTLARISGDQFGMILLSEREPERITAFADTIRRSLRAPIGFGARQIFLTASIGLVLYDGQTRNRDELLKDAELAMYHAKQHGADRIEVFKPTMRSSKIDQLTLESDLRRAIERDEIAIFYQPIVRLEDRSIAGFEALLRWNHPRLGRLGPAEFIPLAEETGLISDLGRFVLERSARQLVAWQRLVAGGRPLFVSVNVSSRQLLRQDLIQEIKAVLSRNLLSPGTLKLELTESLVMENPELAAQMLARIRELGAGLSLDDFGTGYSSLAYLQRFPFDTIKIDKALVQAGTENDAGAAIVRAIVLLAHELGRKVVAEGVEAPEDAAFLRALGCEYAQGFYYGQPMSERDALQLIRLVAKSEKKMGRRAQKLGAQRQSGNAAETPAPAPKPQPAARANGSLPVPEPGVRTGVPVPEPLRPAARTGAAVYGGNGAKPPGVPPGPRTLPPPVHAGGPAGTRPAPPPGALAASLHQADGPPNGRPPPNGAMPPVIESNGPTKGGPTLPGVPLSAQLPPNAGPVGAGPAGVQPTSSIGVPPPGLVPGGPHPGPPQVRPPAPPPPAASGAPPPLMPHQRTGQPPHDGQRTPPPPIPNGQPPRKPENRPLPYATDRETTLPASLTASLDRLAGRKPPPSPEPPLDTAPPERKRSGT
jgi:diguanylate cyclase (GGDEF)-like protein